MSDAPGAEAPLAAALREVERLRAENARLTERLEVARSLGRFGIWERDIPSDVGRWDEQVFAFFGLDPKDGMPDAAMTRAMIHPEDSVNALYAESAMRPGQYSARYRILRRDGRIRWIHSRWQVFAGANGAPVRALGIMIDDTEAIEIARSLGDTSAQLKLAVDLGNIAIWRHDLRTDRMYYNDRAFAVLGIAPRPEGLSLAEVRSFIHPEDLPHVVESAQRALQTDRPTDMEARYRRSDGSWRYVLTRRVVQRGPSGEAQAFVGVALDVTEQVEKQREAERLASRLEATAAAAGVGIWSIDFDARTKQWNPQMYGLVGRDPADGLPGVDEWMQRVVHPEDLEVFRRREAELVESVGELREQVYRIVRPDGEVRWLVDRAICERVDGHRVVHGVSLDLTEQKRTEVALRAADERAALATRGAGIGTWQYDVDTGAPTWDEQMWRLRGLQPAGTPPDAEQRLAIVHPDDRDRMRRAVEARLREGEALDAEFRVIWPDGSVRWIASRSVAVHDGSGRIKRRIGVNWDITAARAAAEVRQQQALAERESQAKSQFLARMSHELRTPLNAVLGFTQLLEHEGGTPIGPKQLTKLGHIRRAGEHLLALIDDVLDLTRLEAGQLELDSGAVPLDGLVDEALPLVTPLAQRHEVRVRRSGGERIRALTDRKRLLQVLLNLLSNAIKYNRRGGEVVIDAGTSGGRVWIEVSDTGRGLDADELSHLFEPFNRLHAEREGVEGTGIGLVIVKALVERMGGTVSVTSTIGVGTRFRVELPEAAPDVDAAPDSAPPPPKTASAPELAGRLLYIEDNPVNVALVEEIVRRLPRIELQTATTGMDGLQRAQQLQPDLILLDMQLPDCDGAEVLARLRGSPATASIPCIAVSANAMPDDISQALALGFNDYWTKPIDVKRFRAALVSRFARSR